jgi:hypothetical protein
LAPAATEARPLGNGEADYLVGVGAYLGWQPLAIAAFAALPLIAAGRLTTRGRWLSPVLSAMLLLTWLGWTWIGRAVQPWLFDAPVVLAGGTCLLALTLIAGVVRLRRPVPPVPLPPPEVSS